MATSDNAGGGNEKSDMEEQEEVLVALIKHHTKEVQHLRTSLAYYKSVVSVGLVGSGMQLDESEKKLEETQCKLARLRSQGCTLPSARSGENGSRVKEERSSSHLKISEEPFHKHANEGNGNSSHSYLEDCPKTVKIERRPLLVIPCVNPKISAPLKIAESVKASSEFGSRPGMSVPACESHVKEIGYGLLSNQEAAENEARGIKRKFGNICPLYIDTLWILPSLTLSLSVDPLIGIFTYAEWDGVRLSSADLPIQKCQFWRSCSSNLLNMINITLSFCSNFLSFCHSIYWVGEFLPPLHCIGWYCKSVANSGQRIAILNLNEGEEEVFPGL
ncbi:hypothetical protein L6452_07460 [Arctium lappa]|uniref:Uncharacterized protein n=1 Tax=Arctium lappa TaxID=4217 RepID=A0ACB9EKH6_ARCLA|nr:hypothetical protein L6452_07460 [Arctium lappa]